MNYRDLLVKFMRFSLEVDTTGSTSVSFTPDETDALETCFKDADVRPASTPRSYNRHVVKPRSIH